MRLELVTLVTIVKRCNALTGDWMVTTLNPWNNSILLCPFSSVYLLWIMVGDCMPLKKPFGSVKPNSLQARCQKMVSWPTIGFHVDIISNITWHWSDRYIHFPWHHFLFSKRISANAFVNSFYDWIDFRTILSTLSVINSNRLRKVINSAVNKYSQNFRFL